MGGAPLTLRGRLCPDEARRNRYDEGRGIEVLRVCEADLRALVAGLPEQLESLMRVSTYTLTEGFVTTQELRAELLRIGGPKAEEVAVTAGEQLIEQGRLEGRLEGERRVLLRFLGRLGDVTPEIEARVAAADASLLERWVERTLSARSLQDVFAE